LLVELELELESLPPLVELEVLPVVPELLEDEGVL
jgi:hypothetical protein